MKPIDDTKICQDRKNSPFDSSAEHDRVVAGYLARIYRVGSARDRIDLLEWARLTMHVTAVGGAGDGLYNQWVKNSLESLGEIEAATGVAKGAKKTSKALADRRDATEADIESLEASIAELQASLSERQQALAGVEAEQRQLDDAIALVEQTEGSAERGGVLALAWTFARDNKHPFE